MREQVRVLVQTEKIEYPHVYLAIWLTCKKLQGASSTQILPNAGGALDQDWETTWALGVIDKAYAEEQKLQENLTANVQKLEELRQSLLRK